jgi:hypothetical protein
MMREVGVLSIHLGYEHEMLSEVYGKYQSSVVNLRVVLSTESTSL